MAHSAGITRRNATKFALAAATAVIAPGPAGADPSFDFIIVGAGSGGCTLAARLSENPSTRVLLLEAGEQVIDRSLDDPANWFNLLGSDLVWPSSTEPQRHADDKALFAVHGRLVGGSGAINATIHHHPVADDINRWGLQHWRFQHIKQALIQSESYTGGGSAYRGDAGPVAVMKIPQPPALAQATLAACDQLGLGTSDDINGELAMGAAINQLAYDGSHRQHGGRVYLGPALDRSNLTLLTGARVQRLIMDGNRCQGVAYRLKDRDLTADSGRVVLCAGALRSPALMMTSGLGPADHLRAHGIKIHANLPQVGQNLHDHLLISGNNYSTPNPIDKSAVHGSVAVVYGQTNPDGGPRDLLLNVSTSGNVFPPLASPQHGFKSSFSFTRPKSRGAVRLKSPDPFDAPAVDHNILSHPDDLDGSLAALELSRRVFSAKAFGAFSATELNPEFLTDPVAMRRLVVAGATSFGHHCGTCRMGDDPDAVVNQQLEVQGVSGLSVVDASIIPQIPSCPTNPLVMAIAELAARRMV